MKALFLHCNSIYFRPLQKAIPSAEEVSEKLKKEGEKINEALVVFTSVEVNDDEGCVLQLTDEIKNVLKQIKAKNVVIYPYVHLSQSPAQPSLALDLLMKAEKEVKKLKGIEVVRAPFGWYKEFDINVKGHPLSELSREIKPSEAKSKEKKVSEKEEISKALKAEEKAISSWYILDLDGNLHKITLKGEEISGFDFSEYENLEKFARYEMKKIRAVNVEPPHVKYMRELELVDYENASDPGNFRFYPKGKIIKALLEEFVTKQILDYGALEVETPIMYDFEHPALKAYLNKFPARQYSIITPNKKVFLRFAACFGQFIMASQAGISYKHLPLRLYELTKYSFRVEQHGELVGLRRLRTFTMPDCHCLCKDLEQAKEEMKIRFELAKRTLKGIGFTFPDDFELGIRVTKDFWQENNEFIKSLVKLFGKPALIEMWPERYFYFVLKYELNFIDALNKASALATDQIDVGNAQNYGITYIDSNNEKKYPVILHLSPSGSIERVMYALLEKAYLQEKARKKPSLPFWLSPIHARIVPVSEKYVDEAIEIAKDLNEHNELRVDVDDRDLHVGYKIRQAEMEWIPYIIVIGKKELENEVFTVRIRETGEIKEIPPGKFREMVKNKMEGMPFRPLSLPFLLSKRPRFV
ncbi:MAG: threonine--tRNA ligase [Candidatus Pacearchaeota archaeon]